MSAVDPEALAVTVSIKAQNPDLETAWRTIAWWEQTCAYWQAEAQKGYALRDGLAQVKATARAEALEEAADVWQQGQWANAPRRSDRVQERLANAQFVTDWLRDRARAKDAQ